jgi:hypothetical protein
MNITLHLKNGHSVTRSLDDLVIGYMRYEVVRCMSPMQFSQIRQRNFEGERFDDLIDALASKTSWAQASAEIQQAAEAAGVDLWETTNT